MSRIEWKTVEMRGLPKLADVSPAQVTSRLDKAATLAAGKTLYYAYGRVLMATTCFAGARPTRASFRELARPRTAALILATRAAGRVNVTST